MKKSHKFINKLLIYPIALIILFEEWGWEPLAHFVTRITRLPFFIKIETKIIHLPPKIVIFIFIVPFVLLLPIKFLAFYLFSKGQVISATFLFIAIKVFGTAICARLFQITKPKLLQISWFGKWYPKWKNWKDQIVFEIHETSIWQFFFNSLVN